MEDLSVREHPGMHRYAPVHGLPPLIDRIVEIERAKTGLALERDQVLMTAGATGGLGCAIGAILEPGEEVLILAPYWPLIEGIVRSFHGVPVPVPVLAGEVSSAEEAVAAVQARLTPRTVALYLSSPNNPTGRLLPRGWVEALVDWAARNDLWILSDEVYEALCYRAEHVRLLSLAPDRTFLAQTFSKCFGMAGNRCGYVVGPRGVMEALRKVATHTFYAAPTAAQIAALRALEGPGTRWVEHARKQYFQTAEAVAQMLRLPTPEGSTFFFFDLAAYQVAANLEGFLEDCVARGVLLAPGPSFGPYPRHVRLCYTAVAPDRTLRGVRIVAELLGISQRNDAGSGPLFGFDRKGVS
jgi:N-succinyldiaminopimelate aminotransferase